MGKKVMLIVRLILEHLMPENYFEQLGKSSCYIINRKDTIRGQSISKVNGALGLLGS